MDALINLEPDGDARRRCTTKEQKRIAMPQFTLLESRDHYTFKIVAWKEEFVRRSFKSPPSSSPSKSNWTFISSAGCYHPTLTFLSWRWLSLQEKAIRSHHNGVIAGLYLWNDVFPTLWSVIGVKHTENNSFGLIIFYEWGGRLCQIMVSTRRSTMNEAESRKRGMSDANDVGSTKIRGRLGIVRNSKGALYNWKHSNI